MQGRTEAFSEARLESLAEDPLNLVYRYAYDTPTTTLPPGEQIELYRATAVEFDRLCKEHPRACNEDLRERVLRSHPRLRLFQHLKPKVFAMCTIRVRTDGEEVRLDKTRKIVMLSLMEQHKGEGTEEDRKARALEVAMKLCVRDATPEEMASTTATHHDPALLPGGSLERLDPSALGGTTVHQGRRRQ
jgi:hypothetical protein